MFQDIDKILDKYLVEQNKENVQENLNIEREWKLI
jgi:hypothetical protein